MLSLEMTIHMMVVTVCQKLINSHPGLASGQSVFRVSSGRSVLCRMMTSLPITGLPGVCFQSRVRGALMLSCVMPAVNTNIMLLLD